MKNFISPTQSKKISLASHSSYHNNSDIFEFYLVLLWKIHANIHTKRLYCKAVGDSTLLLIKMLYSAENSMNVNKRVNDSRWKNYEEAGGCRKLKRK